MHSDDSPMIGELRLHIMHLEDGDLSSYRRIPRQGTSAMRARLRIGSNLRASCAGPEFANECWRYGLKGAVGTASKHSFLARAADNLGSEERERRTSQVVNFIDHKDTDNSPFWHATSNATQSVFVAVFIDTLFGRRCSRSIQLVVRVAETPRRCAKDTSRVSEMQRRMLNPMSVRTGLGNLGKRCLRGGST